MLSSFSIVTFRVVQLRKYSPNSRCRPSSCLLAVLAMFLAIISPSSYSWNECNESTIFVFTTKTTQPRPQVFSVNGALTCKKAALLTSSIRWWNAKFFQIWSSVAGYGELWVCVCLNLVEISVRFRNLGGQNPAEISLRYLNVGGQNSAENLAEIPKSRLPKSNWFSLHATNPGIFYREWFLAVMALRH